MVQEMALKAEFYPLLCHTALSEAVRSDTLLFSQQTGLFKGHRTRARSTVRPEVLVELTPSTRMPHRLGGTARGSAFCWV